MVKIPQVKMADNKTIPQIGLGLWKNKDDQQFAKSIDTAIELGYRHFDTAQAYNNEAMLGEAIAKHHIDRRSLFITTKIHVINFGANKSRKSFMESLAKLKLDYVDLLLLHFPVPVLKKSTWLSVEKFKNEGLVKSIGVSNFTVRHLTQLESYANELPVINQVETHLFLQQKALREYCKTKNIVIEAYSPLAHGKNMSSEVVTKIAKKHNKSYAQIMLKWLIVQDMVVIPKSVNPARIKENIDLFNFTLDLNDLKQLDALDSNLRTCWNPELVP